MNGTTMKPVFSSGVSLRPSSQTTASFTGCARFIEHREHVARRTGLLEQLPLALAHQRAARLPAADELDRPTRRACLSARETRMPAARAGTGCAALRAKVVRRLGVRDEAVEIQVGVELALLREEKRERVDLVNLHDELRRVLEEQVERSPHPPGAMNGALVAGNRRPRDPSAPETPCGVSSEAHCSGSPTPLTIFASAKIGFT